MKKKAPWPINIRKTLYPRAGTLPRELYSNFIIASPRNTRAAVVYMMSEIAMGWYVGFFCRIRESKKSEADLEA